MTSKSDIFSERVHVPESVISPQSLTGWAIYVEDGCVFFIIIALKVVASQNTAKVSQHTGLNWWGNLTDLHTSDEISDCILGLTEEKNKPSAVSP